ncbi:type 4a pilus biogenesis protein PilO [bacterium]|nr:type 4a pilus biogenesis protein PilO [bacterium]
MFDIKNPKTQKILVGLVIFIVILLFWYFTSYTKKKEIVQQNETEIEQLTLELKKISLKAKSLPTLKSEGREIYIRYKLLENLLPSERNVPDFLDKVYSAAKECGVLLKEITPDPSQQIDFYFSDPYKLEFSTSYNQLGVFLSKVLNFPLIIIPSNLKLYTSSGSSDKQTLEVSADLTTYHIGAGQELKPPDELEINWDNIKPKEQIIE